MHQPLIIEQDAKVIERLQDCFHARVLPPKIAVNAADAEIKLRDRGEEYSGIFISSDIPEFFSVIQLAHSERPGTPIFILTDEKSAIADHNLAELGIHQTIKKPVTYSELLTIASPLITMFEAEKALIEARKNRDPIDFDLTKEDADFTPILAERFLSGRKSFFDVYVRLKSGSYVRLLKAGDAFSGDRLHKYVQKGMLHFYIRKEAQESYLGNSAQRFADNGSGQSR